MCVENPCNIRLTSNDWQRGPLYRRVTGRSGRGRELGLLQGVRERGGGRGTAAAAVAATVSDANSRGWRSGVPVCRGGCGGRRGCRSRGRLLLLLLLRRRDCTVGVCVPDPGRKLLLLHLLDHLRRRRWRRRHHLRHLVLRRLQQEERWRGGGGGRGGGRGRLQHLVSTWLLLLQQLLLLLRLLLRPSSSLISEDNVSLLRLAGNLKSTIFFCLVHERKRGSFFFDKYQNGTDPPRSSSNTLREGGRSNGHDRRGAGAVPAAD